MSIQVHLDETKSSQLMRCDRVNCLASQPRLGPVAPYLCRAL